MDRHGFPAMASLSCSGMLLMSFFCSLSTLFAVHFDRREARRHGLSWEAKQGVCSLPPAESQGMLQSYSSTFLILKLYSVIKRYLRARNASGPIESVTDTETNWILGSQTKRSMSKARYSPKAVAALRSRQILASRNLLLLCGISQCWSKIRGTVTSSKITSAQTPTLGEGI